MFLKRETNFLRTTTFRLTLWYLGVFSALSLAVFLVVYMFLSAHLHDQTDNEIMDKAKEFKTLYEEHGVQALQAEFAREAESQDTKRVFFQLLSPGGRLLAAYTERRWQGVKTANIAASASAAKQPFFRTLTPPGHRHRVRVIFKPVTGGNVIIIGSTLRGDEIMLERYRETFGTAFMVMLICGGLVGWLLARKAMSGVQRVTDTAVRIGRHDLGRRVEISGEGAEINALVHAFNDMLERIEALLNELRQITDNVAHELRTPVTRIRGIAETTLKSGGNIEEYREMAASVIDASDDLIEMVNTMLAIAKTDSGVTRLNPVPLDIQEIVEEAAELFAPAAEDHGIGIHLSKAPPSVMITGDRPGLQRVVANLLDNAIKYTLPGGTVTMSVAAERANVKIAVSNTGPAIDKKDIPRLFERFYRCDKSRSTPGSGLGLSLALAIIQAHGGNITVKSNNTKNTFTVSLPSKPSLR